MFAEDGDALEDVFKEAALLARLHHADRELAERLRMPAQRLGQRRAVGDLHVDVAEDFLQSRRARLPFEDLERAEQRHTRAEEVGELREQRGRRPAT